VAEECRDVLRVGYFGSYARDDWGVGSDLDLVVIVADTDQPFEKRGLKFDTTLLPVPADLLVYTASEWEALQKEGRGFPRTLQRETVWVYPWTDQSTEGDIMEEKDIKITIGGKVFKARLNNTKTAQAIYDALPLQASGSYWGDEIYFRIPVTAENEVLQDEVDEGDLAYWPAGSCFCIFFGRTPASTSDRPRPASPVTVIGKIQAEAKDLRHLDLGEIKIAKGRSA
jgi:hypothetical protein